MNKSGYSGFRDVYPNDGAIKSDKGLLYDSLSASPSDRISNLQKAPKKLEPTLYVPYYTVGNTPSAILSPNNEFDMVASDSILLRASIISDQLMTATSTDGLNWTTGSPVTLSAGSQAGAACWTGTEFVLFVSNATNTYGWSSADGLTNWTNFWTFGFAASSGSAAKVGVAAGKLFAYFGRFDFVFTLPLSSGVVTSKTLSTVSSGGDTCRVATFGLHKPGAIIRGKYTTDCVTYTPVVNGEFYVLSANTTHNDLIIVGYNRNLLTSADGVNWKVYNNVNNAVNMGMIHKITADDGASIYAATYSYTTDFNAWYTYDTALQTSEPYSGIGQLVVFKNMLVHYSNNNTSRYRLMRFGTKAKLAAGLQVNTAGAYIA